MKRLRILQLFNRYTQYGGEEGSVFRIGDAMQMDHDVEYFFTNSEQLLQRGIIKKLTVPLLAFKNRKVLDRLGKYQSVGRFDCWLIHNVFPTMSPAVYALAFRLGIPVVQYLHNYKFGCVNGFMFHDGRENRDCLSGNFWPAVMKRTWRNSRLQTAVMAAVIAYTRHRLKVFERVSGWIAISEAQKAIHVEMGIPAERIEVVPHFYERDPDIPIPAFAKDGHALFVGRLSPEKGVDRLLTAWAALPASRRLVIMGDGPEKPRLGEMCRVLKLDNVHFTGFLTPEAQSGYWAGAAFLVVPSVWQEPFGMVILEAWAKGRPVVAHRIGALPEIITESENGLLADPLNPQDLANVMESAFNDPLRLDKMGKNGLHTLETRYNRENYLQKLNHVYEKIFTL